MKKPFRGATLALLAISPFAYLACSDDSVSGGGTFTLPDASVLPIADAAPTLDAGSEPDADADAGPATTATVQVVTATKLPEQNVKIVFYDATGTALGTETTDATGKATHTVPTGGSITALFGSASQPSLVSILGVEPGDALTVLDPARIFNVTFAVTAPTLPTGATHMSIHLGACERGLDESTPPTAYLSVRYCSQPSDVATVTLAALNDGNAVVGTMALTGVTLVEDDDSVATRTKLIFPGPWVTPVVSSTTTATNIPATGAIAGSNPFVQLTPGSGAGIDLVLGDSFGGSANGLTGNEAVQTSSRLLPGPAFQQNELDYFEYPQESGGLVTRSIVTRGAVAASSTLDFSAPLPAISATAIASGATPTVSWTSLAPLTSTKAIVTYFTWSTGQSQSGNWLVYAPPSATSIKPVALPAELAAFGPTAESQYGSTPFVGAIDATFLPSYATVRASAAALTPDRGLRDGAQNAYVPALPVDGTLKVTSFTLNQLL